jgi:hypothetical protein
LYQLYKMSSLFCKHPNSCNIRNWIFSPKVHTSCTVDFLAGLVVAFDVTVGINVIFDQSHVSVLELILNRFCFLEMYFISSELNFSKLSPATTVSINNLAFKFQTAFDCSSLK